MEILDKKAAGRPPKRMNRKVEDRKGIHDEPLNPNNIFELCHNNPDMFKAIAESCHRVDMKIKFIFDQTGMKYIVENNNGYCDMYVTTVGSRLVRYYCKAPMYYTCTAQDLIKAMSMRQRGYELISLYISDFRRNELVIRFVKGKDFVNYDEMSDGFCAIDNIDAIDTSAYDETFDSISLYPLSFVLTWMQFKDVITRWKKFTNKDIIFAKDKENPFSISYRNGVDKSNLEFRNEENIKLVFKSEDIIATRVSILGLSCISQSNDVAETLTFHLPHNEDNNKIVIYTLVDEAYRTKKDVIPNSETTTVKFFLPKSILY